MRNIIFRLGLIIILLSAATAAVCAEGKNSPEEKFSFSSKIKLGLQSSYGNVEQTGYNYKFGANLRTGSNTFSLKGSGKYAENRDGPYQDSREAGLLDTYDFNASSSVYLKVSYYRDWFKGYKYRWNLGGGYAHTWHKDEKGYFTSRIGYQRRRQKDTNDNTKELGFALVGCRGKYPIMENVVFKTEVNYEHETAESENYEADGSLAFVFLVNERIDIELNYKVEYDNTPVEGKEKTDRHLSVYLVMKF